MRRFMGYKHFLIISQQIGSCNGQPINNHMRAFSESELKGILSEIP